MKAQSSVGTYVQEPMKILGMSPFHFAVSVIGAVLLSMLGGVIVGKAAAFVLFIVSMPLGVTWAVYMRRKDPHSDTLFLLPNTFLKGKSHRLLIAGERQNLEK